MGGEVGPGRMETGRSWGDAERWERRCCELTEGSRVWLRACWLPRRLRAQGGNESEEGERARERKRARDAASRVVASAESELLPPAGAFGTASNTQAGKKLTRPAARYRAGRPATRHTNALPPESTRLSESIRPRPPLLGERCRRPSCPLVSSGNVMGFSMTRTPPLSQR